MKKIFTTVILALFLGACGVSSSSYTPDFSAQTNPFSKDWNYLQYYDYDYNAFRRFYESYYLNSSLQECYKNANENFLQDGEDVEFISEGSIDKGFEKLRSLGLGHFPIGQSSFSGFGRTDPKEALELARALRVKYVIYEEKNLGLKEDAERRKRMRVYQSAVFVIQYYIPSLKEKCPRLMQEFNAQKSK